MSGGTGPLGPAGPAGMPVSKPFTNSQFYSVVYLTKFRIFWIFSWNYEYTT